MEPLNDLKALSIYVRKEKVVSDQEALALIAH
jgi:hypothetical protein